MGHGKFFRGRDLPSLDPPEPPAPGAEPAEPEPGRLVRQGRTAHTLGAVFQALEEDCLTSFDEYEAAVARKAQRAAQHREDLGLAPEPKRPAPGRCWRR